MNNIISGLIGALISVMVLFNGTLANRTGNFSAMVIIHIIGLIGIIIILLINKSKILFQSGIPLVLYSAGAIGVFVVLFNNLSFSSLGVSIPLALGLFGQSITSILIDHFGLPGMKIVKFERKKFIGLFFITLGILVMSIY